MSVALLHVLTTFISCFVLISFRCLYRLLLTCKIHTSCHRKWHQDDLYMFLSLAPLIGRTVCIGIISQLGTAPKERVLAMKLLFPGRLCYALFQWLLKLCIVTFYFRITDYSTYMQRGARIVWWFIILTFVGVLLSTLLECKPISLFWKYDPLRRIACQKGMNNLITMGVTNMATDVALIILPIPVLWKMKLSTAKKVQLILLFGVGIFVIAVTAIRLPLILNHAINQNVRSMWASIEIVTACIVANMAFYYALLKDLRNGHSNSRALINAGAARALGSRPNDSEANSVGFNEEYWRGDKIQLNHLEHPAKVAFEKEVDPRP